jgi:serine/threonine protein kinase
MWTEQELLSFTLRLVSILVSLQQVNVAHRNIKPANLVFGQSDSKTESFGQMLICNFEMATCFQADSHYADHLCTQ